MFRDVKLNPTMILGMQASQTNPDAARIFVLTDILNAWLKGRPYHEAPAPLFCNHCRGFTLFEVKDVTKSRIHLKCRVGHDAIHATPIIENDIQGSYTRREDSLSLNDLRSRLARAEPPNWKRWSKLRFHGIPTATGYEKPEGLFLQTALAHDGWKWPHNLEAKRIMLICEGWRPFPNFIYVQESLTEAARATPFPEDKLEDVAPAYTQGAFFFPKSGEPGASGLVAFRVLDEGFHAIGEDPYNYYLPTRKLLLWLPFPDENTNITAEITLSGRFEDLKFNHEQLAPKYTEHRELIKTAFRVWAVLNTVETQTHQFSSRTRNDHDELVTFKKKSVSIKVKGLGFFSKPMTSEGHRRDTGYHLPPHWKRGHKQRYHYRQENGQSKVIWVYKNPYPIHPEWL